MLLLSKEEIKENMATVRNTADKETSNDKL